MTNFFVLVFSRQNYDKNSWTRVVGQASHTWSSLFNMFLTSSFTAPFHFILMEGFDDFCFCSFAPNFTHSTKIMVKSVKPHGQDSLLYVCTYLKVKSFSLLFIITKKRGKIIWFSRPKVSIHSTEFNEHIDNITNYRSPALYTMAGIVEFCPKTMLTTFPSSRLMYDFVCK